MPSKQRSEDGPLLVFGPRSLNYDFGPAHPLTPRRFGPGIDLLSALGADPGLAPEPAGDDELLAVHDDAYVKAVRRHAANPNGRPEAGIGPGDTPAFAGMHEASAAVAGGSLQAMDAILRGEIRHAFHPGGGLHHAMPGRAAGFCVYNDPALAIQRARAAGLRVLYLDFDVHHGDGVEAIHGDDPGVLTFSIHESGETLFPGTGFIADDARGEASGTVVNLPLDAGTGADPWLAAVSRLVPELAAAFGPDVIVSQHGCDGHAWDPLAHLRLTTTAIGAAARLTDTLAHRHAGGRWLATGGGGYDVYGVVPRAWSLVWLAGAHRPPPAIPTAWLERWTREAARYGRDALPAALEDAPKVGATSTWTTEAETRAAASVELVRAKTVPALIRAAVDAGWWRPESGDESDAGGQRPGPNGPNGSTVEIDAAIDAARWAGLDLAARVAGPLAPLAGHAMVGGALRSPAHRAIVTGARVGRHVVGLAASAWDEGRSVRQLLALGVTPGWRRQGIAGALLATHVAEVTRRAEPGPMEMLVTTAERDVVEPLARDVRADLARRLLGGAGFRIEQPPGELARVDPLALRATWPG